jgi:ribosome-associated protein
MRKVCTFCDFFVIASGTSLRQVNAIAHAIEEELLKAKVKPFSNVPAADESGWVVLDYNDVVVHVFSEDQRAFYDLENLWSDAKRVRIPRKPRMKS